MAAAEEEADKQEKTEHGFHGLKQKWDADDNKCDESIASEDGQGGAAQDDRKVRVRTLISEEQSLVLKTHYQMNPRPKQ